MRSDDPARMEQMRTWLRQVAAALDLDPRLVLDHEEELLGLVAAVAHGPTRPGAPLTAFLVGVAAGRGAEVPPLTARVAALVDEGDWPEARRQVRATSR